MCLPQGIIQSLPELSFDNLLGNVGGISRGYKPYIRTLAVKHIRYNRLHFKWKQMYMVEDDCAVFGFRKIVLHNLTDRLFIICWIHHWQHG